MKDFAVMNQKGKTYKLIGKRIHGGKIIAKGTYDEIKKDPTSITGRYLSHKKRIPIPIKRRDISKKNLKITKA